jgi:hypothetical protein
MAVETSPGPDQASRPGAPDAQSGENSDAQSGTASGTGYGPADQEHGLLPGERVISEIDSNGEGRFQLTHARVIYSGGRDDSSIYASAQLKDISAVRISRRPRARRSAAWGLVGLFSAIGVWQVTPNSTIGVVAALAVALISLVLMADYWIRPAGVHLEFQTAGGEIGGEVGGRPSRALAFAREVEDTRRRLVPGRTNTPFRNYPSG